MREVQSTTYLPSAYLGNLVVEMRGAFPPPKSKNLTPAKQPFDIAEFQLDIGRAAVIALAG